MKKVLIALMMLLLSCTAVNARTEYTITSVACSINDSPWSDWCAMNCLFVMDQENKQVRIYSDVDYSTYTNKFSINSYNTQVIDYGNVYTSYGTNNQGCHFRQETIKGNDKNGLNCTMYFMIFDDGDLMFIISYKDIKYKYMLQR